MLKRSEIISVIIMKRSYY